MTHVFQFLGNHWLLCGAFLAMLTVILFLEAQASTSNEDKLTPQSATQLINRHDALLIDIRDSSAYRHGHIVNSLNIPSMEWDSQQNKLQKYQGKPIILVDALGQKVQTYVTKLKKSGFTQVKTLAGGINAWRTEKLPLVKGDK